MHQNHQRSLLFIMFYTCDPTVCIVIQRKKKERKTNHQRKIQFQPSLSIDGNVCDFFLFNPENDIHTS